jgi:hypothetical protein
MNVERQWLFPEWGREMNRGSCCNLALATGKLPGNLYRINNAKKIFFRLPDAFELLFEDVNPLPDVFKVPATRENDLS